ncbi:MAG: hypothetical protein WBA97_18850 [Actinophytocola sp.]|uniref:hypothetical protein n=1 Tax=Actinophytocola sp. TaxID=1872138 RepID=UPI003C75A4D7
MSVPPPGSLSSQALVTNEVAGLRRLANLMIVAQTTEDITGAEMLAAVQDLAPTARRAIRSFAKAAIDGEYDVDGTWVDPGRGTTPLRLTQRAARRLTDAAAMATEEITKASMSGAIDGWEWSTSTIKFRPAVGSRFRAHVPERLANEAARLGAQRDLQLDVLFTVVTKYGAGSDRPTGRGYTVERIAPSKTSDTPPF